MRGQVKFLAIAGIFCLLLAGCGEKQEELINTETVVQLRVIMMGNEPAEGMEELYDSLDALTIPELGCRVRLTFVPWGNERKQLNIAVASGEYDIIPGGVFSDYQIQISKNAFLDLKDYLYLVPDLVEHYQYYSEDFLTRCEVDGGLYGIAQFGAGGLLYDNEGFFYREDLRREWGCPEIVDLDTMEQYLYAAKKDPRYRDEALITDNRIWQSLWIMLAGDDYLEVSSMQETPFVVVRADDPGKVLCRVETPEFKELLGYIRKWKKDGILEADMLSLSDNEGERGLELILADRKPCETNAPWWAVSASYMRELTKVHPEWTYGFFAYIWDNQEYHVSEATLESALYVSSRTKYSEKAVKLLEKIHTDQRYYDLFLYGIDGIHYHDVDGAVSYEGIPVSNKYGLTVASDALLAREELSYNSQWTEVIGEIDRRRREILEKAAVNPIGNFEFMAYGIDSELERLGTVRLQYFQPLVCGYYEGEQDIAQMMEKLREAGLPAYMEAMEAQLKKY